MRIKRYSLDPFKHVFFEGDGETGIIIKDGSTVPTVVTIDEAVLIATVEVIIVDALGQTVGVFPDDTVNPILKVEGKQILSDPSKPISVANKILYSELTITPELSADTDSLRKLKGLERISGTVDEPVYEKFYNQSLGNLRIELGYFNSTDEQTSFDFAMIQIVDSHYFGINEIRDIDRLSSVTDYSNELLQNTRSSVEAFFDDFTLTNWTIKGDLFGFSHPDENLLPSDKNIKIVNIHTVGVNGQAITDTTTVFDKTVSDIFVDKYGRLYFLQGTGTFNPYGYLVEYEWGEGETPSDLSRAAKRYAEHILLNDQSVIPDRARMLQTAQGMLLLDVASMDKPTGLPEVDSILLRRRRKEVTTIA